MSIPFLTLGLLLVLLWWALSGGAPGSWPVGLAAIALALAAQARLRGAGRHGLSVRAIPAFLGYFVLASIRGGIQVAALALRPRTALRPAMLAFDLRLERPSERMFLAAVLSLLPGTLSAGLEDGRLTLHVLDRDAANEDELRGVERRVARLFGREGQ